MKSVCLFMLLVVICSCASEPIALQFWKISDAAVTEERISVLMVEKPNIINIAVKANTDAPFQIIASGNRENKIYKFETGAVDTILSENWNSAICRTKYVPMGVQSGDVNISVNLYAVKK